jgi:imidazolonepropionase-like amidohydrolase
MKRNIYLGLILVFFATSNIFSQTKTYEFTNGQWFDGKTFKRQTMYSINGVFAKKKPNKIDENVDLQNGFVIPPFADAHTHHFDSAYSVSEHGKTYLKEGIFYAKVQTNVRTTAMQVKDKVNTPTTVDVSYAHGALTHTYGHGIEIYEAIQLGLYTRTITEAQTAKVAVSRLLENDAYYIIDTAEDLEKKWQKILDGKPDFIKIYLLESEDFEEKRKNIPKIRLGSIGLDPKLVPRIVQKAHAAGLRVSAHVDTVTDYRIALNGGVDEMAHLPGYYVDSKDNLDKYLLTEKDVKETPIFFGEIDTKSREKTDMGLKANFTLLKKYKAKIAFGSDRYGSTPLKDVFHIKSLGVFSNLELLKIWTEDTPLTILPNRKLGKLKEGYEASFITVAENPLINFEAIKNINLRFKQGVFIELKK